MCLLTDFYTVQDATSQSGETRKKREIKKLELETGETASATLSCDQRELFEAFPSPGIGCFAGEPYPTGTWAWVGIP